MSGQIPDMLVVLLVLGAVLGPALARPGRPGLKIIGGSEPAPGQWPWQGSLHLLLDNFGHYCGCTLVSSTWLTTAAHCVPYAP